MYSPLLETLTEESPTLFKEAFNSGGEESAIGEKLTNLRKATKLTRTGKRRSQSASNWKRALQCVDTRKGKDVMQKVHVSHAVQSTPAHTIDAMPL